MIVEAPHAERHPRDEAMLSPRLASDIVVRSFEFSQGKNETQRNILRLIRKLRPGWEIPEPQRPLVEELTRKKIESFLSSHRVNSRGNRMSVHTHILSQQYIFGETTGMLHDFFKTFSPSSLPQSDSSQTTARLIAKDMMEADLGYLSKGRPRLGVNPATSKGDPYFSMVCDYGLKGKSTGIQVYDEMFDLIKAGILERLALPDDHPQRTPLTAVPSLLIQRYNERHPLSPITVSNI